MVLAEPGIFWEHSHEHRSVLKEPACCNSKTGSLKTKGPAPSRRILLRLRDGVTEGHFCHHLWTARLATLSEGNPTDPQKMLSSETSSCLQRSNNTDSGGRCPYTLLGVNCVCPAMLSVIYPRGRGRGASDFISLCSVCRLFLGAGGAVPVLLGNQRVGLATMSRGRWDRD